MQAASLKVGELARRSGVSVRTLHYYGEIGLLVPSQQTPTGHRLYAVGDVARLQQIVSLRQLGLTLAEIRDCLGRADWSPGETIERHLARVREQMALQRQLCDRLEGVASALRATGSASLDDLLYAIEVTKLLEKYTPEQRALFEERERIVGQERIREVEAEWPILIAEVRAEMERGADPASDEVQGLVRRWQGLILEFTGGSQEIERLAAMSIDQIPAQDPAGGIDHEMVAYIQRGADLAESETGVSR
jgi:MerR family transcriptional regulator, thiopeptide resistance regulator